MCIDLMKKYLIHVSYSGGRTHNSHKKLEYITEDQYIMVMLLYLNNLSNKNIICQKIMIVIDDL